MELLAYLVTEESESRYPVKETGLLLVSATTDDGGNATSPSTVLNTPENGDMEVGNVNEYVPVTRR